MGNQNSSNPEKKKEKKEILIETKNRMDTSYGKIESKETNSSYKGVKTCGDFSANDLKKEPKEELTTECQTIPENLEAKEIKIPTDFEWKEGGNVVYITGTFSNWSQWFIMNKINNKFELNLVNFIFLLLLLLFRLFFHNSFAVFLSFFVLILLFVFGFKRFFFLI
jgi:hypothetical protein